MSWGHGGREAPGLGTRLEVQKAEGTGGRRGMGGGKKRGKVIRTPLKITIPSNRGEEYVRFRSPYKK